MNHLNMWSFIIYGVCLILYLICISPNKVTALLDPPSNNMTFQVFGNYVDGLPAAFGDFNSDEWTDMFVLKDNLRTLQILLGGEGEPVMKPNEKLQCKFSRKISSVVPGDFDGDALMDVMITLRRELEEGKPAKADVIVLWGKVDEIDCGNEKEPLLIVVDQPLALFYSPKDMIVDLFGVNEDGDVPTFWEFNGNRTKPTAIPLIKENSSHNELKIRYPHSNAFLDLNNDNASDLYITTETSFEFWLYNVNSGNFEFDQRIRLPPGVDNGKHAIGQTLFLDLELKSKIDHILPVCFEYEEFFCRNGTIFVYSNEKWHNLRTNFVDSKKTLWGFPKNTGQMYTDTVTVRGGDFNMDGYPDLLVTLGNAETTRVFYLENVQCLEANCDKFERDFVVRWDALNPMNSNTVMGVFYDFMQDGILDVLLVNQYKDKLTVSAFKNNLDYDANFLKVMVITPLQSDLLAPLPTLWKHRRTPGTNLPGPKISYKTTTTEGQERLATSIQLPQSAHFALGLPYSIFGLGRTPNFIETLYVGMWNKTFDWPFVIPNSQVVIIPYPPNSKNPWKMRLFVTPSKIIIKSAIAIVSICLLILSIIGVLYYKERRADRVERLREAHRFHFDAM